MIHNAIHSPSSKIARIWKDQLLRKVLLDILVNTQLHRCRQVKVLVVRTINQCLAADEQASDEHIYNKLHALVHTQLHVELRLKLQHKERYRATNRAQKIANFVRQHGQSISPKAVLDVGCDDGSITAAVAAVFSLQAPSVHGTDIVPLLSTSPHASFFTYHWIDETNQAAGILPFANESFDLVYAFMSLHHVRNRKNTIAEVYRTLRPNGLFVIREHDLPLTMEGYSDVLDVVHGFYDMVWSNPPVKNCFETEFWAHYTTSEKLDNMIAEAGFTVLLNTSKRTEERFPKFFKGKVVNPLRYYYAVYKKKI
jgi:ubiquinone/menaquinone biosynthesis C-methylase UbiE